MASKQEKIRRMMGSFVGGSVSVATIAVVTSFQISLQATFLDLTVFQNAAYYELEIIETVVVENSSSEGETPQPQEPFPTRLWIENQWGNVEIALTYGLNEGHISPLRENESYVLSIQYQSNIGWSTLATETIKTAPKLLANVDQFSFEGGYLDETINLQMDISTQVGFRPVDRFEVNLSQGEQSWLQTVPVGQSSLRFENLPHRNIPYDVSVLAWIQNQPEVIYTKQYSSMPFVHGTYERYFSAPRTLVIQPTQLSSTLTNETYTFELTSEMESLTRDWNGRDAVIFENIAANQNVLLTWYVQYDAGNLPQKLTIQQEVIQSIASPVFVISVSHIDAGSVIQLTIDRTADFTSLYLYRQDQSYAFELVHENEVARYYEINTEEDVSGLWELRGWLDEANPILYQLLVFQL